MCLSIGIKLELNQIYITWKNRYNNVTLSANWNKLQLLKLNKLNRNMKEKMTKRQITKTTMKTEKKANAKYE